MSSPGERLKVLLNSSTPIVIIETVEEVRAVELVRVASAELDLPVFEWNIADGLTRSGSNTPVVSQSSAIRPDVISSLRDQGQRGLTASAALEQAQVIGNTREPVQVLAHLASMTIESVVVLKDFHRHIDDPVVVRRLRDVAQRFCSNRRTLVITGPVVPLPAELVNLVEFLDLPLPDAPRLRQIVESTFAALAKTHSLKRKLDDAGLQSVAENLRGLTEEEAERAISQAIIAHYGLTPEMITEVLEAKKSLLGRSGLLEFIDVPGNFGGVGGMENLKRWLQQRSGAWEEPARNFGLEPPRGVIILGVQGCGKSMCARAIAGQWQLPLVKFDNAAIFDKYIGESEKRIKKLFEVAEQLAPAVLWIDELEKVFAGSGPSSASSDAGVSSHVLASFLSWMQDRTAPVFIAATSNNVSALPPELIRKGRFDELFFVDLPNLTERREILSLQLKSHKQDPARFDLEQVAAAGKGYSGAELNAAVQTALYSAFGDKHPLTTECLLQAIQSTVPLSTTRAEEIQALRLWAQQRAVPASPAGD
jgi:hypothetical protein